MTLPTLEMNDENEAKSDAAKPPGEAEKASLRRELVAILVLYIAAAIAPLLFGFAVGPRSS